jgi:hypothetical protein
MEMRSCLLKKNLALTASIEYIVRWAQNPVQTPSDVPKSSIDRQATLHPPHVSNNECMLEIYARLQTPST